MWTCLAIIKEIYGFNHISRAKVNNWTDWSKLYDKGARKPHITQCLWREETQHTHVKRRLQIFVFTRKFQLIPRIPPEKDILVGPFGIYRAFSQYWVSTESTEFSSSNCITRHPSKGRVTNPRTDLRTERHCACTRACSVVFDSFDPLDCSPPGSSVHGIFQAKIWSGMPFPPPGDPPDPRIKPTSPASPELQSEFFYSWATWEAQRHYCPVKVTNILADLLITLISLESFKGCHPIIIWKHFIHRIK